MDIADIASPEGKPDDDLPPRLSLAHVWMEFAFLDMDIPTNKRSS